MTIKEAFEQVMMTPTFKEIAKGKTPKGGHYRLLRSRYKKDKLKFGAMVDILIDYGYTIIIKK
jgi:hypothetical protein